MLLERLKALPRLGKLVFDSGKCLQHRRIRDGKDRSLRLVEYLLDVAMFLESQFSNLGGCIDQASKDEFSLHTLCVMPCTAGRCRGADEF